MRALRTKAFDAVTKAVLWLFVVILYMSINPPSTFSAVFAGGILTGGMLVDVIHTWRHGW